MHEVLLAVVGCAAYIYGLGFDVCIKTPVGRHVLERE